MDLALAFVGICSLGYCPRSWNSIQSYILTDDPPSRMQWVGPRLQTHWLQVGSSSRIEWREGTENGLSILQPASPQGWNGGPKGIDSLPSCWPALRDPYIISCITSQHLSCHTICRNASFSFLFFPNKDTWMGWKIQNSSSLGSQVDWFIPQPIETLTWYDYDYRQRVPGK